MRNDDDRCQSVGSMTGLLWRFASDESGVSALEYSIIAMLVGIAVIGGASIVGLRLDTILAAVSTNL